MESDESVIRQYKAYQAAKGRPVEPWPGSVPCPDCQGNGVHVKTIPLLKIKVGRVCKTCKGAGYLPGEKNEVNL